MCRCSRGCSGNASEDVHSPMCTSHVRSLCHWKRTLPTRTTLDVLLMLWYLKQLLSFLIVKFPLILAYLGHFWHTFGLLFSCHLESKAFPLGQNVSSSFGNLHISAPILCCHQSNLFVPPCYSFDCNAELQDEARKKIAPQFSYSSSLYIFRRSPLLSHHMCLHDVGCGMSKDLFLVRRDCYEASVSSCCLQI